jgi:hypothetical protein
MPSFLVKAVLKGILLCYRQILGVGSISNEECNQRTAQLYISIGEGYHKF